MKRSIILILIFTLLFCFPACTPMQKRMEKPVSFYYLSTPICYGDPDGLICAEQIETKHLKSVEEILKLYLRGPVSPSLSSPFPTGVQLYEFSINPIQANIILSRHINNISDIELTLACACLAKTILDMTGIQTVVIDAEGGFSATTGPITYTRENLILYDPPVIGSSDQRPE